MSGWQLVMISPSSSISRRSTPCVDGCCGPMLRTMRRTPLCGFGSSTAAADWLGTPDSLICLDPRPRDRIVLSQRVAFPSLWHQNTPQVGMVPELDTEQIEDFPLVPVRAAPHRGHRFDRWIRARQPAFQAQPLVSLDRIQMVDHFEPRLARIPVHCRHRAQPDKLLIVLEKAAHAGDLRGCNFQRQLSTIPFAAREGIRIERIERRGDRMFPQIVRYHWLIRYCFPPARSDCDQSSAPFFQM